MSYVIQVPSSTNPEKKYTVRKSGDVWVCDCPDHIYHSHGRQFTCKHIAEVATSLFAHIASSAVGSAMSQSARDKLHLASD